MMSVYLMVKHMFNQKVAACPKITTTSYLWLTGFLSTLYSDISCNKMHHLNQLMTFVMAETISYL